MQGLGIIRLVAARALVALAVAAGAAMPALAQTPSAAQVEAARDVLDASNALVAAKGMIPIMTAQITRLMRQMNPTQGDFAATIIEQFASTEFNEQWPDMEMAQARVYAAHFTLEELRGLEAFYKSPLGRKLAENQPVLTREQSEAGRLWGERVAKIVLQKAAERLKEAPPKPAQ